MIRNRSWRRGAASLLVAFILTAWQLIPGGPTPATAQDPHHPGTPTGDPCAALPGTATPMASRGPQDMPMMGTPGVGMGMIGEFDLMFIDLMIPHHESAIAMAQVALVRAEHDEITRLAQDIIASQSAEVKQMRAWRQAWYPDAPAMPMDQMMGMMSEMMQGMPGMEGLDMMGMMGMAMDLAGEVAALCAAPAPSDLAFIDAMIPHHRSAVAMAEVALQRATHPELKQLAQAIIDAQLREIGQMEAWQAAWYGGTPAAE